MPNWPVRRTLAALLFAVAAPLAAQGEGPIELAALEPGKVHPRIVTRADPETSYALYLPTAFDSGRPWPLLLVFDPRSRGAFAAELFAPAAERHGWIVASSNDTRSDTPNWQGNVRALQRLLPDVEARLPIEGDRLYAAGMSGGAQLAWILGQHTGELAGVVSVGGQLPPTYEGGPPKFALFTAAGKHDFNYEPSFDIDRLAAEGTRPHRFESFAGRHGWFTAEDATVALDWLEIVAMLENRREPDRSLAAEILAAEVAGAERLVSAGDPIAGHRRLEAAADALRSLADVAAVERRMAELERSDELRAAQKEAKRGLQYEENIRRRTAEVEQRLRVSELPALGELRRTLTVPNLIEQASRDGLRGDAARRALALAHVRLAFYTANAYLQAGEYVKADVALTLGVELRPEDATAWYNLACARARLGRADDALAALERSLDLGVPLGQPIGEDPDLASLHGRPEFAALAARSAP
jgi:tetratricopeptide (TPR) repeat protein